MNQQVVHFSCHQQEPLTSESCIQHSAIQHNFGQTYVKTYADAVKSFCPSRDHESPEGEAFTRANINSCADKNTQTISVNDESYSRDSHFLRNLRYQERVLRDTIRYMRAYALKHFQEMNRKPMIIMYDVNEESRRVVTKQMKLQNGFKAKEFKVKYPVTGKNGNIHWVIEVSPSLFKQVMKTSKIKMAWTIVSVSEFFSPSQCFNCLQFGHFKAHCANRELCFRCGESDHRRTECNNLEKCVNCKNHNQLFGSAFCRNHNSFDIYCPSRKIEIDKLQSKTDYVVLSDCDSDYEI